LDCLAEYTEYFLDTLVSKARPASPDGAQQALAKKQAIKDLYRERDPGVEILAKALGPSEASRIARLLY
ncbi:MAG: hypothetical protein N3E40_06840, partial [Dehalococcoidia bacterium]|nr:hypothetical protein [Dehalococcoidia bacterium]